jgi:hypothetical protein
MRSTDPVIRGLRIVAPVLAIGFTTMVVVGLASGTFAEQGRQILDLSWGRITLVDAYLAFAVPVLWMWIREPPRRAVALTVGVVVLGSAVIWGYLGVAAWNATERRELLLGSWEIRARPVAQRWRRARP